jgi:hypothetical protein
MGAKIFYRDAVGRQGTVELGDEPAFVGRSADCAIRSEDAMVSRKHAVIRRVFDHYEVEDLGSSNGIEVNGKRVDRHVLVDSDSVRCGSVWLRYSEEDSSETRPSPAPTSAPRPFSKAPESARTLVLPAREMRRVMVPDAAEVQRLRDYIEEILRQLMDVRAELDKVRANEARLTEELERLRGKPA